MVTATHWMDKCTYLPIDGKVPPKGVKYLPAYQGDSKPRAPLPGENIGVLVGNVSDGLTVVDFDGEPGRREYDRFCQAHPELSDTFPTVQTGGGVHLYFQADTDQLCRDIGERCHIKLERDGVRFGDLKVTHGYVVCPPSVHHSGRRYEWKHQPDGGEMPSLTLDDLIRLGLVPMEVLRSERVPSQGGVYTSHKQACLGPPNENPFRFFRTAESRKAEKGLIKSAEKQNCHQQTYADLVHELSADGNLAVIRQIERALTDTQPTGFGQRNSKLLELASRFRQLAYTKDRPAQWFRGIVYEWYRQAFPNIGTKNFGESLSDFYRAWNYTRTKRDGPTLQEIADATEGTKRDKLKAVCEAITSENGTFWIGCRTAGELLDTSHVTANKMLNNWVADGLVEIVQGHQFSKSPSSRMSRVYRWIITTKKENPFKQLNNPPEH